MMQTNQNQRLCNGRNVLVVLLVSVRAEGAAVCQSVSR